MVFLAILLSILPINTGRISITSDFGEARPLRFHMGLDFSTHGRIGLPVFSVEDGVVIRVKRSYYGYGNAIYVLSKDSLIYVYAHLNEFIGSIEDTVFSLETRSKKYRQDIYFQDSAFVVKKGEIIGFSGESGVGYPHLHFEKRVGWLLPIFPLLDTISLRPYLEGVLISVPSSNYVNEGIRFFEVKFPSFHRFKMYLRVRHSREILISHQRKLLFHMSIDTLNYLFQTESGLLFKPRMGSFSGFIRTNFDSHFPHVVKKSVPEYSVNPYDTLYITLVSFYGDSIKYRVIFDKSIYMPQEFYKTCDGVKYSYSDYGIHVSEKAKKLGYKFIKFNKDTLLFIGDSNISVKINTHYFPYLNGIFYRISKDTLCIYPELPQLTGYIWLNTSLPGHQVYRITDNGLKFKIRTLKLGCFVTLKDTTNPVVKYVGGNDSIAFYVNDVVSGIDADSMSLYVNGKWYPVYYDFERKIAVLRYSLPKGKYKVKFRVSDRAHNIVLWKKRVYLR